VLGLSTGHDVSRIFDSRITDAFCHGTHIPQAEVPWLSFNWRNYQVARRARPSATIGVPEPSPAPRGADRRQTSAHAGCRVQVLTDDDCSLHVKDAHTRPLVTARPHRRGVTMSTASALRGRITRGTVMVLMVVLAVLVGNSTANAGPPGPPGSTSGTEHPAGPAASSSPSDQLATADEALVGDYEAGRSEAVKKLPLVLLVTPGVVTAYRGGRSTTYVVPAQSSIDLKACSHALLGFHGVMQPVAAGDRSAGQWARVVAYRQLVARMPRMILDDSNVPSAPAHWCAELLTRLHEATSEAIVRHAESRRQLIHDERAVRPLVNRVVAWSGKVYVAEFRHTLRHVRRDAGEAAWKHAWAIVGASPAATRDNLETGIMIKALGHEALGHRLFLSQNQFDAQSLLDSLSGLYYDQTLAETFFDDPFRMWRDLFAPEAVRLTGQQFYPQPATRTARGH
jgi:hypothetical protein